MSFLNFSSFTFKEDQVFNEEGNPSHKVAIVKEELDDIDIADAGNLEDLPRYVLMDKECGNPKAVD